MQMTAPVAATEDLVAELQARPDAAPAAVLAVRRVRELEQAVERLRASHAALPAAAARDPERGREIVRLLSQVMLFRLALAGRTDNTEHNQRTP